MGLFQIKEPARKPDVDIICDVDSIVERRAGFTLNGQTHYIDPITTEKFLRFVTKLSEITAVKDDPKQVRDKYLEMIQSVCSTVSSRDIDRLTHAQSIMLFAAICDKVMGKKPMTEDEKKNS